MSKAVLIMDMPENCYECKFFISRESYCSAKKKYVNSLAEYVRPSECPLKELPKELLHIQIYSKESCIYDKGWNDCLDKIIGKSEVNK